ncbi:MAG: hypothetical protein FGM24_01890 [Candidatus Kapabacteria bacterium]|nr:hypothetical protein [Candidatus Kapabacteria bacterium]
MTFLRMEETFLNELRRPDLIDLIESMSAIVDAHGTDLGPSAVEAVRRAVPAVWQQHIPTLLDIVMGTRRAARLGKHVDGWLFTETSSQQATHPSIAEYHATRFSGCRHVVEVCQGAGLDTRALARACDTVTSFEADAVTAAIAQGNFARTGITNVSVVCAHVPHEQYRQALATADAVWADPSRRDSRATRQRRGGSYDPPIALFTNAPSHLRVVGVKVGPGDEIDSEIARAFTSEYIGWRDECRERVLWRGVDAPAVALVDVGTEWRPHESSYAVVPVDPQPDMVLVEPHAAIMASGKVTAYFRHIGAAVIDHRIGYGLCAADPGASALHRRFRLVQVEHGIDAKRIQRQIRLLGWGRSTEVKKRGVDIEPMTLHRSLDFAPDGPAGVILLARGPASRLTLYAVRLG